MKVQFEDHEYDLNLDDITVAQAKTIKVHTKLTLKGLTEGLSDLDPDALRAAYWLMQVQSGLGATADLDRVDFKAVRFAEAIVAGLKAERDATEADADDGPKE